MFLAPVTQFRVSSADAPANVADTVDADSDHELMLAVRAGDVRRLGAQPSASEDLVQIVFYRILKYRHTYRDEGKFSAWIYHLARKVSADHFRKHASTPVTTAPT